jgi:dynein heavy chain
MFVGNTGTGKTANIMSKLNCMDPETTMYSTINMNSFSDAPSLQVMMEQPLEKKSGVRYGPPGSRKYAPWPRGCVQHSSRHGQTG